MATRTPIATDDFNRASIGSDWAQLNTYNGTVGTTSSLYVYSSGIQAPGSGGAARWVGAGTFTDDQYASIVIKTLPYQANNYYTGVIVRASADNDSTSAQNTRDFYFVTVTASTGGPTYPTHLGKVVNGTITTLYTASATWAVNDRLELEVEGTELRVCKNGTALGGSWTQTDAALSTGLPGVMFAGSTTIYADDWEGGSLSSGSTVKPWGYYAQL